MRARLARLEAAKQFADNAAAQLGETFQSLADAALRSNQGAFLGAARATLDTARAQMTGDLAQKQTAIEGVVQPLSDSLGRLEDHVRELERAREKAFGSLGEQLQSLARETTTLSTALRSPQARGRWGEVTLRRVAELAGMVKNCDFWEQETHQGDGVRIRPDMTVRLPSGRTLVVDAKVPLTAYLDAAGAADEAVAPDRSAPTRPAGFRACPPASEQAVLEPVPAGARAGGAVSAGRSFLQRGAGGISGSDRRRAGAQGGDRDAGHADLGFEGHRLRLEPAAAC